MSDMDGIVLTRPEFLVLMDAVGAGELVGIDSDAILPSDSEEHKTLIREGINQLVDRSLLEVEDDVHVINGELLLIARIVAHPQLVVTVGKEIPGLGEQRFLYYQVNQYIVEHTMPEPKRFRLATIPNTLALINRIEFILPVQSEAPRSEHHQTLEQELYFGVQRLLQQGKSEEAEIILDDNDFPPEVSRLLVSSLQAPIFTGIVGFFRCEDQRIIDARDMAVIQSDKSAWMMHQAQPGEPKLILRTTNAEQFRVQLFELLRDLVRLA